MYSQETIVEKNITLAFEFERYILEHPEILERIPHEAEVVLLPKDDPQLYQVNLEKARRQQQKVAHTIIFIEIDALTPPRSRLVNPQFAIV